MMQLTSHKSVFKQYYLRCLIIIMLYISFVVLCIYVHPNIWSAVFCTILYIPVKFFIRISANKTIASVLFNDLNAQQFQQLINSNKHFYPPLSYRINAAFFSGDYQTVVNIASCQMQKKKLSTKKRLFYLSLLARVYFDLRDYEKLKIILNKYNEIKELYSSKTFTNTQNSILSYYLYFLDGDFKACKIICKESLKGLPTKTWDAKIRKLNIDFTYAVACYENGDIDEAKECFESIILYAPKMHSSEISGKYVDAIKTNSKMTSFPEILPEKNFQLYDDSTTKKIHRHRIITTILLILVCISVIASNVINFVINKKENHYPTENNSATVEFESNLSNAIAMNYDKANFITYFNVTDGAQHIDSFCLVEHSDGLDLASIVTYDSGESLDLIVLIENVHISNSYSVKSAVSNHQIDFTISDTQISTSNGSEPIEFSLNNKNYWIVIKSIRSIN